MKKQSQFFENSVRNSDPLLSIRDAADYLNISEKFIRARLTQREIKGIKIGRIWRIRRSTLEAWLTAQKDRR